MSVVVVAFLFACCSGSNQPPTLTIVEAEHTSSETTATIISKRREANIGLQDTDGLKTCKKDVLYNKNKFNATFS